jgi:hypothetical protein
MRLNASFPNSNNFTLTSWSHIVSWILSNFSLFGTTHSFRFQIVCSIDVRFAQQLAIITWQHYITLLDGKFTVSVILYWQLLLHVNTVLVLSVLIITVIYCPYRSPGASPGIAPWAGWIHMVNGLYTKNFFLIISFIVHFHFGFSRQLQRYQTLYVYLRNLGFWRFVLIYFVHWCVLGLCIAGMNLIWYNTISLFPISNISDLSKT